MQIKLIWVSTSRHFSTTLPTIQINVLCKTFIHLCHIFQILFSRGPFSLAVKFVFFKIKPSVYYCISVSCLILNAEVLNLHVSRLAILVKFDTLNSRGFIEETPRDTAFLGLSVVRKLWQEKLGPMVLRQVYKNKWKIVYYSVCG